LVDVEAVSGEENAFAERGFGKIVCGRRRAGEDRLSIGGDGDLLDDWRLDAAARGT